MYTLQQSPLCLNVFFLLVFLFLYVSICITTVYISNTKKEHELLKYKKHQTINASIKPKWWWCQWEICTFMDKSSCYICRIDDRFGQSSRYLEMMVKILCTGVAEAIRINHQEWVEPLGALQIWIKVKESIIENKRVKETRSRTIAMAQMISSTSMQGSSLHTIPIAEEEPR